MSGKLDLEFQIGNRSQGSRTGSRPFNILVLGDFGGNSGIANGSETAPDSNHGFQKVDIDTIDSLWRKICPTLDFEVGETRVHFSPRELEDFHPDQLYSNLQIFADLRHLRQRLSDPVSADEALAELLSSNSSEPGAHRIDSPQAPGSESVDAESVDPISGEEGEDMFTRLLGKQKQAEAAGSGPAHGGTSGDSAALDSWIRKLVAPHIVREADPRTSTAIQSVDLAISQSMRDVLHQPAFQALESAWRALHELVFNIETDEVLSISLCNISREELLSALPDPGVSLQESALFQLLVEQKRQAADDAPWTLIVGNYYFGHSPEDIALLTALGAAAAVNGGVFLGGARAGILGCRSTAELADARYWSAQGDDDGLWQSLRTSPVAGHIGLALPRVLARLPYGEHSEEIDSFEFDEMPRRRHEDYLWANPAFACARLLADCFTRQGWAMEPGGHLDLGSLPAHHYKEDGESKLPACAEVLLSESTMMAMLEKGLMPLISYRNQNTAVLSRFQSIAEPASALAGPWGE